MDPPLFGNSSIIFPFFFLQNLIKLFDSFFNFYQNVNFVFIVEREYNFAAFGVQPFLKILAILLIFNSDQSLLFSTVKFRLYVQVGTQKF